MSATNMHHGQWNTLSPCNVYHNVDLWVFRVATPLLLHITKVFCKQRRRHQTACLLNEQQEHLKSGKELTVADDSCFNDIDPKTTCFSYPQIITDYRLNSKFQIVFNTNKFLRTKETKKITWNIWEKKWKETGKGNQETIIEYHSKKSLWPHVSDNNKIYLCLRIKYPTVLPDFNQI
jgi:hypothetical protein